MQNKIDNNRFKKIYTMVSCILDREIDIVIEELKNKTYDNYIISKINERLSYSIDNKSDIEISFEVFKGIGGYEKVNPDYKGEISEIVNNYTMNVIKRLKLGN